MKPVLTLGQELWEAGRYMWRNMPPLPAWTGMTLDRDDVDLAEQWLKKTSQWGDAGIVSAFERAFAKWNGSAHTVAFSAGRKALSACIYALNLQPGDAVIVPGYTCIVVQNAFDFADLTTVHCDIELDTYGPLVESVASRITPRTRALLLHHLYGLVCRDYEAILELAHRRGLKVIEDCAHSTGATFRERHVGTYGDVAFYSLEWSKVITTIVGGVAVTNNPELAVRMRDFAAKCAMPQPSVIDQQLRTVIRAFHRAKSAQEWWALPWARFIHGLEDTLSTPESEIEGHRPDDYFTRMPAPAAALGLNQLRKIEAYNEKRRLRAAQWDQWCDKNGYRRPLIVPGSKPVFLRYPVLVEPERKSDTDWADRELHIELGLWFKTNLHPSERPVHNCPNADKAVAQCVNLPCL